MAINPTTIVLSVIHQLVLHVNADRLSRMISTAEIAKDEEGRNFVNDNV